MTTAEAAPVEERQAAYRLTAKQAVAMDAIWVDGVEQLLYGGAGGGGKSQFDRILAFHCAHMWPGARIAVFRENYTQLQKTQLVAWFAEMEHLGFAVKDQWHATTAEWWFEIPDPLYDPASADHNRPTLTTVVEFLHLDQSIGAEKWLSAEWAAIFVDEATQMSEEDLALLYSRVRVKVEQQRYWKQLADMREETARAQGVTDANEIKRVRSDWRALGVYTTNPGSRSHKHFKEKFVDQSLKEEGRPWLVSEKVYLPGMGEVTLTTKRQFVQAYLTDNAHLDPIQYASTLAHLPKQRREQILSGDWGYFEGKVFYMLDKSIHWVDARWVFRGRLAPPQDWPRLGGLDHGTANPTAAEWITQDEDSNIIAGYLEYYGTGPNAVHIGAIRSLLQLDGRMDMTFMADPTMYYKRQGHTRLWSVADEFAFGGEPPEDAYEAAAARTRGVMLKQSDAQRIPSRMALERLLECDPDRPFPSWHPRAGELGAPRMFICGVQAPHLWADLDNLRYVEDSEETVKEDDHAYDAGYRGIVVFERARYMQRRGGGYHRTEIRTA